MNNVTGNLYIIAAPSGAGKTSLIERLVKTIDHLEVSVSYTTRPMRPGEVNGVNYFFIDHPTYKKMLQQNVFLEHATVYGEYYGTSRDWVVSKLNQEIDIILEIDWQGAQQVQQLMPECITIFILPPSLSVLRERLLARGQDDQMIIEKRMQQAKSEISHCFDFDYLVVNDYFDKTIDDLTLIIKANQFLQRKQQAHYSDLIKELIT